MAAAKESSFLIKDPVHGSIELSGEYLKPIIDSKEFQRLRKIKQLGGASYVYPGATHTRFEHSIGVCYIASELLKYLKERDDNFNAFATESDIKCVKIAALCHDLGHGPFSHLYDFAIPKKIREKEEDANHEYRSVKIFNRICEARKRLVSAKERKLIGKLITFSEDYKKGKKIWKSKSNEFKPDKIKEKQILKCIPNSFKYPLKKMFLFEIVANGFTGIDVDKMDYFLRDGYLTGLPSIFDWRRYIQTLRVLKNKEGIYHLCSRDKEERELYQLFHVRTQLYHQVYRHKTTIAVEHMLGEVLSKASKHLSIRSNKKNRPILEAWRDIDSFLLLDDSVEDVIMLDMKLNPPKNKDAACFRQVRAGANQDAKVIIENIRKRKLCKYIGDSSITDENEIKRRAKEFPKAKPFPKEAEFTYGMKELNPITFHYFYKKKPNPEPYRIKEPPSKMLPTTFSETKMKCFVPPEANLRKLDQIKKRLDIPLD